MSVWQALGGATSPDRQARTSIRWVPDEEVNDCPVCQRLFSAIIRKHHCRACGKVFCDQCSSNQLFLQEYNSKQRVCDPCYVSRSHAEGAALLENLSTSQQVEAALKLSVKEKSDQAAWFQNFLVNVASEGSTLSPTSDSASQEASAKASSSSSSTEVADAEEFPGGPELRGLLDRARRHWTSLVVEHKKRKAVQAQMLRDCQAYERRWRETELSVQTMEQNMKSMEVASQKNRLTIEAERESLQLKNRALQEELDGLKKRAEILEAQLGGFYFQGTFLSQSGPQRSQRCSERCSLM